MIVYLPGAMRDLRGIGRWYAAHRPERESVFFARLRNTLDLVEREPLLFPRISEVDGLRRARVLRSPYSLIVMVRDHERLIVAVIHGARRPDFWRGRAP